MTRKDYVLIAESLKDAIADILNKEPSESHTDMVDGVGYAADFLAERLGRANAAFNTERFLEACGVRS